MEFDLIREHLATQPNWAVTVEDHTVQVRLPLADGRTQAVTIRRVGHVDAMGVSSEVIEFSSIVVEVPAGKTIPPPLALRLLQTNSRMLFGAWGLGEHDGRQFLAIYESALLATLDVEELVTFVTVLATEADRLEHEWGGEDVW